MSRWRSSLASHDHCMGVIHPSSVMGSTGPLNGGKEKRSVMIAVKMDHNVDGFGAAFTNTLHGEHLSHGRSDGVLDKGLKDDQQSKAVCETDTGDKVMSADAILSTTVVMLMNMICRVVFCGSHGSWFWCGFHRLSFAADVDHMDRGIDVAFTDWHLSDTIHGVYVPCLKDDPKCKSACETATGDKVMVADATTSTKEVLLKLHKIHHGEHFNRRSDGVLAICLKADQQSEVACATANVLLMMNMLDKLAPHVYRGAVNMDNMIHELVAQRGCPDENTCGWTSGHSRFICTTVVQLAKDIHGCCCVVCFCGLAHMMLLNMIYRSVFLQMMCKSAVDVDNMNDERCCDYMAMVDDGSRTACKICRQVFDGVLMCLKDDPKSKVACVTATMVMDMIAKAVLMMRQENVACAATLDKMCHQEYDGVLELKDDSQSKVACETVSICTTAVQLAKKVE